MRIYLAAPFDTRRDCRMVADALEAEGIGIASSWIHLEDPEPDPRAGATLCITDLASADAFVALELPQWAGRGQGGRHVEFGIALATRLPIVIVGDRSHVFHYAAGVSVLPIDPREHAMIPLALLVGWLRGVDSRQARTA